MQMRSLALALLTGSLLSSAIAADQEGSFIRDVLKGIIVGVAVDAIKSSLAARDTASPAPKSPGTVPATLARPSLDEADQFGSLARRHFELDQGCKVDEVIALYSPVVYYDKRDADRDSVRRKKLASCAIYGDGSRYEIRPDTMLISHVASDRRFKVVDYVVDFDVYNRQTRVRTKGASAIRVVFDTRYGRPTIIGESHERQRL